MPPKKSSASKAKKATSPSKSSIPKPSASSSSSSAPDDDKKRKRSATPPSSDASLKALLQFLLNDANTRFGNGSDAAQPNLFDHMQHSADYTPFQKLVGAVIMSKPISSRLGARTLLTIFAGTEGVEDGIDFSTPAKIRDAGGDGRYEALSKARTQHKDKTSLQLGRLADKVIEEYANDENDTSLNKMREELGDSSDNLAKILKSFYGFGDMAADIFRRSMQADWEALYPFADERTINAAAHLGLAHENAEALAKQVKELLPTESNDEERKQFTRIVDALVATDLEHRYEDLLEIIQQEGNGKEAATEDEDQKPKTKVAKKDEDE